MREFLTWEEVKTRSFNPKMLIAFDLDGNEIPGLLIRTNAYKGKTYLLYEEHTSDDEQNKTCVHQYRSDELLFSTPF
jgi:hypothetical protein